MKTKEGGAAIMMTVGSHVWHKATYSDTIVEGIITHIERTVRSGWTVHRQVTLEGVTIPGTYGADYETLYPSREAAVKGEQIRARRQIDAYKQELRGPSKQETMERLIAFAYDHVVSSAEEYTDTNAQTAYRELANEIGIELA